MKMLRILVLVAFLFSSPAAVFALDVDWGLDLGPDAAFFPSLAVSLGALHLKIAPNPNELGDPNGLLGVFIVSPRDGAKADVEIRTAGLIAPSRISVTLPKKGVRYFIYPFLSYDTEKMVLIRQPFAETVVGIVSVDGKRLGEKSGRVTVRSINDCVFGYKEDNFWNDTTWLYAAYVNENHPAIETILKEALASEDVDSFSGYQGDADDVEDEIEAVWDALARRGIKYSSISDSSAESDNVWSQHVRLLGEALASKQANCVEGACLLASIFYKIGLNPYLIMVPGHMFLGVDLDDEGEDTLYLEATLLDDDESSFEDACDEGEKEYAESRSKLTGDPRIRWRDKSPRPKNGKRDMDEYGVIDIRLARELGILPIREPAADRARFKK